MEELSQNITADQQTVENNHRLQRSQLEEGFSQQNLKIHANP